MSALETVLDQLEPEQKAELLNQVRNLRVNDNDPMFGILAMMGYYRIIMEQLPAEIRQAGGDLQQHIDAAISSASNQASYEAAQAAKQDFAEFSKKAIAISVEKSQDHSAAALRARTTGYRWMAGACGVALVLGVILGWLGCSVGLLPGPPVLQNEKAVGRL